jgi:hypothetical protein
VLAIGVALVVGLFVAVALALALGVALALALGLALAFTATPLFQTNLPLTFTQVNCLPAAILFSPAFLQVAPAFTDANAPGVETPDRARAKTTTATDFLIYKYYWNFSSKARSTAYSQYFRS